MRVLAFAALIVSSVMTGCITLAQQQELVRKRAAFDLDCGEPIRVVDLGNRRTFGASGCGRRATYIMACAYSEAGYTNIERCTVMTDQPAGDLRSKAEPVMTDSAPDIDKAFDEPSAAP